MGLLIGVAGLFGSRLGNLWIAFDVFSQFTLQFAAITLGFLIGLFIPRAKLTIALLVIIASLVAIGAWPQFVGRYSPVVSELKTGESLLRVASFNTWYDNNKLDELQAEIERLDVDVVVLIEFGPNKRKLLAKLEAKYPYKAECFSQDYCHLAMLSKRPMLKSEARVGWEGPPLITAKFGPELGNVTVIGVHTIRFPHARAQFRQIREFTKMLETIPGPRVVMGDFNATPFSRIIKTVEQQTGFERLTSLPSWPSWVELPQVAIDHVFISPGIRVLEAERLGNPAGSDHYPVTMQLAVPGSG
jgi:endonuclease/exonuclease/phosphatase (EEP) superfamily protein YafD